MALLVPTSFSSFGDATSTEGPGRLYVLAQVRDTANVDWVAEARRLIGATELKWTLVKNHRPRLRNVRHLWARIESGLATTTLIVVDMDAESHRAFVDLIRERGTGWGSDWGDQELRDRKYLATIARCPLAFLPDALAKALPTAPKQLGTLYDFAPEAIRARIGPRLKHAVVLAARAHAVFDVDSLRDDSSTRTTQDAFTSPFAPIVLAQVLASPRTFDDEAPQTLKILNEASDVIAAALGPAIETSPNRLVSECSSAERDHLQAADVAAGWARELIELKGYASLVRTFDVVWLNGQRLR